jgi:hypothetical protein
MRLCFSGVEFGPKLATIDRPPENVARIVIENITPAAIRILRIEHGKAKEVAKIGSEETRIVDIERPAGSTSKVLKGADGDRLYAVSTRTDVEQGVQNYHSFFSYGSTQKVRIYWAN